MIIIKSQDGLKITKAETIYTLKKAEEETCIIKCEDYVTLGRYKNEDRAKEVIEETEKHMEKYMFRIIHGSHPDLDLNKAATKRNIFCMPKE